ncbi:MAG: recombination mediator RecR [Oscillospiraceae bacterium]|nr:recombination mediator RecR [Oscillospiraceae bacterium]
MKDAFPAAVEHLVSQFARQPGVGRKSAQRLAFYVLSLPDEDARAFGQAVLDAKRQTGLCPLCLNLTDIPEGRTSAALCAVCRDERRDRTTICVVSEPRDAAAIERAREYRGVYHILHGVISPAGNKSPDDIRIRELLERAGREETAEVILATNPDTEGDTTALYIARLLQPFELRVTRLAYGIPIGGHVEFADAATLLRSLEGRREM